jgi:tRNA U34 5-carboxymethylaminomethyl modifying GTPase MnmE/TrmE
MYIDDTIAAIATPPGIGGVGIIRVSGKDSFPIVNSLFKSAGTVPLMDRQNRTIQYGTIVDPTTNKTIDEVLVLLMKGPHSYTAEDVVEIQCHGGIVPVRQILKLLVNHDVRMAEAGEFTKRAFMNGRIDLTQAEAIIDIIEAKTGNSEITFSELKAKGFKQLYATATCLNQQKMILMNIRGCLDLGQRLHLHIQINLLLNQSIMGKRVFIQPILMITAYQQ